MSVAAVLAGIVHELFDLAGGQVFSNCTIYSVWWASIPSLISHRKFRAVEADWKYDTLFLYSVKRFVSGDNQFVTWQGVGPLCTVYIRPIASRVHQRPAEYHHKSSM